MSPRFSACASQGDADASLPRRCLLGRAKRAARLREGTHGGERDARRGGSIGTQLSLAHRDLATDDGGHAAIYTAKDLAQMARERGVAGWHSMRKEELIRALVRMAQRRAAQSARRATATATARTLRTATSPTVDQRRRRRRVDPRSSGRSANCKTSWPTIRNLAAGSTTAATCRQDRLVVMVRDPYWLHAYWELAQRSVDRAKRRWASAGMAPSRCCASSACNGDAAALHERDIPIHGGVNNWYVDVQDPPADYRLEIGYLADDGFFYCLARSNEVSTPPAGTSDAVDENWTAVAENADRIFAMSGGYSPQGASRELQELLEERLRRPLGSPMKTRFGSGAAGAATASSFEFAVDAEIIVYGAANRDAHVTLQGEPVQLRGDGTFAVRLSLPDRRQVIPIVASSYDGVEQRTTILAVERNTKVMEPLVRDVDRASRLSGGRLQVRSLAT